MISIGRHMPIDRSSTSSGINTNVWISTLYLKYSLDMSISCQDNPIKHVTLNSKESRWIILAKGEPWCSILNINISSHCTSLKSTTSGVLSRLLLKKFSYESGIGLLRHKKDVVCRKGVCEQLMENIEVLSTYYHLTDFTRDRYLSEWGLISALFFFSSFPLKRSMRRTRNTDLFSLLNTVYASLLFCLQLIKSLGSNSSETAEVLTTGSTFPSNQTIGIQDMWIPL